MSAKSDARQQSQLRLYHNQAEITVGDPQNLPLPLDTLLKLQEDSPYLRQTISSGLTGTVYQVQVGDHLYNVKRKRAEILVKNPDGLTSFLNEVQIRRQIEQLRLDPGKAPRFRNIVHTLYASHREGIIVSPWIEGSPLDQVTRPRLQSLFSTWLALEMEGIFDLDPCPGNLLVQGDEVILFDFGYTYHFDPRNDYNPDGREFGLLHMAERFESRFLSQYLIELEDNQGQDAALEVYRMEKEVALDTYQRKLDWLRSLPAEKAVLDYVEGFIREWEAGLQDRAELNSLYRRETFLAYSMDAKDDLHGRSCTPATLKKIDRILDALRTEYSILKARGLFWGEEAGLDQAGILDYWTAQRRLAEEYQLSGK